MSCVSVKGSSGPSTQRECLPWCTWQQLSEVSWQLSSILLMIDFLKICLREGWPLLCFNSRLLFPSPAPQKFLRSACFLKSWCSCYWAYAREILYQARPAWSRVGKTLYQILKRQQEAIWSNLVRSLHAYADARGGGQNATFCYRAGRCAGINPILSLIIPAPAIVPHLLLPGGDFDIKMLIIVTSVSFEGIFQMFGPFTDGPARLICFQQPPLL